MRAFRASRKLEHPGPIGAPIHLADALECDLCGDRFEVVVPPKAREDWNPSQGLEVLIQETAPELVGTSEPVYRAEDVVLGAVRGLTLWPELSRRLWVVFFVALMLTQGGSALAARVALGVLGILGGLAVAIPLSRRALLRTRIDFVVERVARYQFTRPDLVSTKETLRGRAAAAVEVLDGLLAREPPSRP